MSLFGWTVEADLAATREAYRTVGRGAALRCGCPGCLNFDRARPAGFAPPLRSLLAATGIDPCKEHEVRLVAPLEGRKCLYAGAYLFCGRLVTGRPYRGFPFLREEVDVFERVGEDQHVALHKARPLAGPWADRSCVRVEFLVVLPWVGADGDAPVVDLGRCRRPMAS